MTVLKKVWFHLHPQNPQTTVKILKKFFKKITYINVNLEDKKCIISSTEVPDLNSWVIEKLLSSKVFMGRYHLDHPTPKVSKIAERVLTPATRFGYMNSVNYPEDKDMGQFFVTRTDALLNKMPMWLANKLAAITSGWGPEPTGKFKTLTRNEYVEDLVKHHKKTKEEAQAIIDKEFPQFLVDTEEVTPTPEEIHKAINDKAHELIKTLKFYSPKERKQYLDRIENFDKYINFGTLCQVKGREWILDNVGEVQDWT
jgi:hypothetical protein